MKIFQKSRVQKQRKEQKITNKSHRSMAFLLERIFKTIMIYKNTEKINAKTNFKCLYFNVSYW